MKKSQFSNEKGVTLIELLAAIGLLAVMIVLSTSALFQLIGNTETVGDNISLNQKVNLAINDLRNQFEAGNNQLCVTVDDIQFSFDNITNGTANRNCIEVDTAMDTLSFTLIASHDGSQKTLNTAFEKKSLSYSIDIETGDKPPSEFTEEDDITKCTYNEDVKFNNPINNFQNGNADKYCHGEYTFEGNVAFLDGLSVDNNHNNVDVHKNMYVKGNLNLKEQSHIDVDGNLYVLGNISIGNNASITINGNLYLLSTVIVTKPNGLIKVDGTACQIRDVDNITTCEMEIDLN